jgi:hypothetical protein
MSKLIFYGFSDAYLIVIGFILFMGTFLGAFFWTVFIQKKSFYDDLAQLPLQPEGDVRGLE